MLTPSAPCFPPPFLYGPTTVMGMCDPRCPFVSHPFISLCLKGIVLLSLDNLLGGLMKFFVGQIKIEGNEAEFLVSILPLLYAIGEQYECSSVSCWACSKPREKKKVHSPHSLYFSDSVDGSNMVTSPSPLSSVQASCSYFFQLSE